MQRVMLNALLVLALVGCGRFSKEKPEEPAPAVSVPVVEVAAASAPTVLDVTGTVVAEVESRVAAGATGRVQSVEAQRGKHVREGETLLVLDDRVLLGARNEARAAAAQAEAQATMAADDCRRAEALFEKGVSDEATIGKARANCAATKAAAEAARARVVQAEARFDYSRVRAPFTGTVAERLVDPGEYVRDDTVVFSLVADGPMRLQLTVPPERAGAVHEGSKVTFTADDPTRPRVATVDRVAPGLREKGRDLVVEALIEDPSGLRPGAFVDAHIEVGTQDVPVVPKEAVRTSGELHTVFVVQDGRLEARIVEVGDPVGDGVAITDGVKAGEKVASPLNDQVRDGARIQ